MKYILKKPIEGLDWEVGDILDNSNPKGHYGYLTKLFNFAKSSSIPTNPLEINAHLKIGTFEKVEEETQKYTGDYSNVETVMDWVEPPTENKRWRSEVYGIYYYVTGSGYLLTNNDNAREFDNEAHTIGNYFQTESQAQAVANRFKQILLDSHK